MTNNIEKKIKEEVTERNYGGMTLVERLEERRIKSDKALILDTSGSMDGMLELGHSKISALREIVSSLVGNPVCFSFNSTCQEIDKNNIPDPRGGTCMSRAFIAVKEKGIKEAIMITDGNCNQFDQEAALREVYGLKLQIMYVGPEPKPKFLDGLAARAGSFCSIEDLKETKKLGSKIQLLLAEGEKENKKGGPICL